VKGTDQHTIDLSAEQITLGPAAGRIATVSGIVGIAGLAATVFLGMKGAEASAQASLSFLVSWTFYLSIVLGALFFVLIQHLTRAGWSVVVRRMAEALAANAGLMAVLGAILVALAVTRRIDLFPWLDKALVAAEPAVARKAPYLNATFFVVRVIVYFAIWAGLGAWFFRQSVRQDESGDPGITTGMQKVSAPGVILFAITLTLASFDFLMSLEPAWYSTIFGVYYFAGSTLSAFAALVIFAFLLQRSGRLASVVTTEHYHDLGKLMFAFTIFWTYIAFSQYMLIWYANIPEETLWFDRRQTGEWTAFSWFLLLARFFAPFLALISRGPKRRKALLAGAAVWVLLMQWIDMYYLAMPHASPGRVPWSLTDATAFVGIGGLFVATLVRRLGGKSLIPRRDPRLAESLAFENF
jgi:hypothetical protein